MKVEFWTAESSPLSLSSSVFHPFFFLFDLSLFILFSLLVRLVVSFMVVHVACSCYDRWIVKDVIFGYLMSSILLTWFNHFCLYCVNFFSTVSILSSLKYHNFSCGLINFILLWVSWISSLLSLVFCPFVSMSRFHGDIKVTASNGVSGVEPSEPATRVSVGVPNVLKSCTHSQIFQVPPLLFFRSSFVVMFICCWYGSVIARLITLHAHHSPQSQNYFSFISLNGSIRHVGKCC
jgi:hypothetical protein